MRYVKIFLLHFQSVFEQRSKSFVWFLNALINPLILILFWKGVTSGGKVVGKGWDFYSIASYYFYLIIAVTLIVPRIERYIAENDIQRGNIFQYLLRPFSYFWKKFLEDAPNRVLQGVYASFICLLGGVIFGTRLFIIASTQTLFLSFIIIVLAFFLAYVFKIVLALCAFWLVETDSLFEGMEILSIIFGGYIMPIILMPQFLKTIAYLLPFSYMIYFPVVALQGKLTTVELFHVILIQCVWLGAFSLFYHLLWMKGIKKFMDIGH